MNVFKNVHHGMVCMLMGECDECDVCDNEINEGNDGECYQSLLNNVIAFTVV
jgi:hypothetical protein